jgi:2-polyprenyl-3-methyl-5-hydroxy-6-metoxy-1,4-benzoquinol methylase
MSARDLADYEQAYVCSDFEAVQARLRKRQLLTTLDAWRPRNVLEVGCADDPLFTHWPAFERFVVVEPGASFARAARRAAQDDARVRIVEATLEDAATALRGETFDAVIASGLLHEVPDAVALLRALAAVCAPHTRLHLNVPNARSLHRLLALEMGLIGDLFERSDNQRRLQQPRTFDQERLAALCRETGFEVTEQGSYFVKPFTHAQMARLQSIDLLDERMLDGLWGLEKHLPGLGSEIFVHLRRSPVPTP